MYIKILEYLKKYWWIILIIISLVYSQLRINNVKNILETTKKASEQQIEILNKSHEEEILKRDLLISQHEQELKALSEDYQKQKNALAVEKNKKIQIIVKYYDNPDKLASKISEAYGIKYVAYEKNNNITH